MRELLRARTAPVPAENRNDRPRRLRATPQLRELVRETRLHAAQLVAPIFVVSGRGRREEIASLKGHARLSPDLAEAEAGRLAALGVGGVLLFGIPDSKDVRGEGAADDSGPVPETLRRLKASKLPLVLAADVCLCEYTTHGHCGVLDGDRIDNDATLPLLAEAAIAYAEAGADIVAPSAMMDGQVAALRAGLDGDHRLRLETRFGALRTLPRSGWLDAGFRRSQVLPDGPRQRARGNARAGARRK